MRSVCLMTCYMGPLPDYFQYFTATCKKNPSIHFIVINDRISESYTDENIKFIKMSFPELNAYASLQLKEKLELHNSWKINELKPLFGHIFESEFAGFDHWGWCDLDLIWGDIRRFLTDALLNEYDVITTQKLWCTGHFTLFKNNDLSRYLYKRNDTVIELLNSPVHFSFEECAHRWHGEIFSFDYLRSQNLPISMFDIIKNAEKDGEIKAYFENVIIREYPQPIHYEYRNDTLIDTVNRQEFMYYHLLTVKKIWRFYLPPYKLGCDTLFITPRGIRCGSDNRLVWEIKRLQNSIQGIRKSAKNQSITSLVRKLFKFKRTWV